MLSECPNNMQQLKPNNLHVTDQKVCTACLPAKIASCQPVKVLTNIILLLRMTCGYIPIQKTKKWLKHAWNHVDLYIYHYGTILILYVPCRTGTGSGSILSVSTILVTVLTALA